MILVLSIVFMCVLSHEIEIVNVSGETPLAKDKPQISQQEALDLMGPIKPCVEVQFASKDGKLLAPEEDLTFQDTPFTMVLTPIMFIDPNDEPPKVPMDGFWQPTLTSMDIPRHVSPRNIMCLLFQRYNQDEKVTIQKANGKKFKLKITHADLAYEDLPADLDEDLGFFPDVDERLEEFLRMERLQTFTAIIRCWQKSNGQFFLEFQRRNGDIVQFYNFYNQENQMLEHYFETMPF